MLVRDIFSPRAENLLSPEQQAWFRELCRSDWVKCNKDVDYDDYQNQRAEEEAEELIDA